MKELNRKTLKEAIDKLPEHKAPGGVWERVQEGLTDSQPKRPFQWGYVAAAVVVVLLGVMFFSRFFTPVTESQPVHIEAETAIDSTHQLEPVIESHVGDSTRDPSEE